MYISAKSFYISSSTPAFLLIKCLSIELTTANTVDYLKIPTSNELLRIRLTDLVCIQAEGNYCLLTLASGWSHRVTLQLGKFVETFHACNVEGFIRVGRSLIVNHRYVTFVSVYEKRLLLQGAGMKEVKWVEASHDALQELKKTMEGGQYGV